jgi:hypothetical protein
MFATIILFIPDIGSGERMLVGKLKNIDDPRSKRSVVIEKRSHLCHHGTVVHVRRILVKMKTYM